MIKEGGIMNTFMNKFKVGDKVVRSDMDLTWVHSQHAKTLFEDGDIFKLVEDTSKHHKHHDSIIAWAKGAIIQYYNEARNAWFDVYCNNPLWSNSVRYRIKPAESDVRQQKIDHIESEMRKLADQLNELKSN